MMVISETIAFWILARRLALAVALFTVCISGDAVAGERKMPQKLLFEFDPSKPPESTSPRNLFRHGKQAYLSGDYVSALVFLYAYVQKNPNALNDQNHREQVFNAIRLAEERIRRTFPSVQSTTDPRAVSDDPLTEPHSGYESRQTIVAMIQTGQTTCWDGNGNEINCA
jgi:hypothetical protein